MTKHEGHPQYRELGAYTAPAAPVQGEEVVQGTSEIASASVRSPHTEIASSPWQPIETAPKDGTAIWVLLDGQPCIGYCEPAGSFLRDVDTWFVKASFRRRDRRQHLPDEIFGCYAYDVSPSDWMPLPAPPRTQVGDNLTGASTSEDGNCPQLEPFPAESGA